MKKRVRIIDEDETGFADIVDEEDRPVVEQVSEFKFKTGGWKPVGQQSRRSPSPVQSRRRSPSPRRSRRRSPSPVQSRRRSPSPEQSRRSPNREAERRSISPSRDSQRMEDGSRAGLLTAKQMKQQLESKRQTISHHGKDATTVHRDKSGRKLDMEQEMERQKRQDQEKQDVERKRQEWGRGQVQASEQELLKQRLKAEERTQFSFYADDKIRNQKLKERDRWGDPMAKQKTETVHQSINRFNITPGRRWDGVDRSNGFEHRYFQHMHKKQIWKQELHQWSTEDM
ncbi:Pre-mRNA-splicing factor of RES complex-domain-containing protein [Gorgonomyces haynaldii]|nr:Pre-mRNA-splicing factor of RES complex-domain-containing protein [Gorgonomyces haynaldii]